MVKNTEGFVSDRPGIESWLFHSLSLKFLKRDRGAECLTLAGARDVVAAVVNVVSLGPDGNQTPMAH